MKNEPFYFDSEKYNTELKKIEFGKAQLQKLIIAFSAMTTIPKVAPSELNELFINPQLLIANKLIKQHNISFNGISVKPNKVFDLFDKPLGMDEFMNVYNEIKENTSKYNGITINIEHFGLNAKDEVVILESTSKAIKTDCEFFLTNENQRTVYEGMKVLEKTLNELREAHGGLLNIPAFIGKAFGVDFINHVNADKAHYKINPKYVLEIK